MACRVLPFPSSVAHVPISREGSIFHETVANQREHFAEACYANLCRLCEKVAQADGDKRPVPL